MYPIQTILGAWKRKANQDLFEAYRRFFADPGVRFEHVRGHRGIAGNELVDFLAREAGHEYMETAG